MTLADYQRSVPRTVNEVVMEIGLGMAPFPDTAFPPQVVVEAQRVVTAFSDSPIVSDGPPAVLVPFSETYTNLHIGRLLFGSCFDENSLVTRAYTLSIGVAFRGTPGSQLFKIDGGIQVAFDH
jgi:hypothetical protein